MIAVEPNVGPRVDVERRRRRARRSGRRRGPIGQIPICWDPDGGGRRRARPRAVPLVRRGLGGQRRPADDGRLRRRHAVRPARRTWRRASPCGPDLDQIVDAVSAYWEAGFTDVALVQVGGDTQERFLDEAAGPLLEKLRSAAP